MTSSTPDGVSYVYVIGSSGSAHVKIGTSISPEKRLKELQTGNPGRLELLWCTPGGRDLESALHKVFDEYRTEGEWFDFREVQPVGAIPLAVYQRAVGLARTPARNNRSAPKRSGPRAEQEEHTVTPERLAAIVRDVVSGVLRPEREEDAGDDGTPVRPRFLSRTRAATERAATLLFRAPAARTAQLIVDGKTGFALVGGWRSIAGIIVRLPIGLPVAAHLVLRTYTGDIWPVRKLPLLALVGWTLWVTMGFHRLITDFVISRLPMEEIEAFARTYLMEAAIATAWFLAMATVVAFFLMFAMEAARQAAALRAQAEAEEARKATATGAIVRSPLSTGLPPAPLVTDLIMPISQRLPGRDPVRPK
ncbi:GIY-YIG nuclease family protein [Streptomyces sp. NPDC056224]|uniref:GIY-YIG nuclease family protein n=1 Tax=Streptomyces sp. NPDC056224 TaxID=3345750 RepID=UPI0035D7E03C